MNTILQDFKKYFKRLDENIVSVSGNKGVAIKDINFYSTDNDILNNYKEISPYFESDFKNMIETVSFIQDDINGDLPPNINSLNETKYFTFLSSVIDINEESNLSHNQKCIEYIKYKLIPRSVKSINEKLITTLNETREDLLSSVIKNKNTEVENSKDVTLRQSALFNIPLKKYIDTQVKNGIKLEKIISILIPYLFVSETKEFNQLLSDIIDIPPILNNNNKIEQYNLIIKKVIDIITKSYDQYNVVGDDNYNNIKDFFINTNNYKIICDIILKNSKILLQKSKDKAVKTQNKTSDKTQNKNNDVDLTPIVIDILSLLQKDDDTSDEEKIKQIKRDNPLFEERLINGLLLMLSTITESKPLNINYTNKDDKTAVLQLKGIEDIKKIQINNIQKINKINNLGHQDNISKDEQTSETEDVMTTQSQKDAEAEKQKDKKNEVSPDGIFKESKHNDIFKFLQETFKDGGYISDLTSDNIFCKIASYVIKGKTDDKNNRVDIKDFTLNGIKITVVNKKQFITFSFEEGDAKTLNVIDGKIETLSSDDIKKIKYDSLTFVTLYGDNENILNILSLRDLNGEITPEDKDKLIKYTSDILKLDVMDDISKYETDNEKTIKPIKNKNFESEKYYMEYQNIVKIWRNHIANKTIVETNDMLYKFNESFIKRLNENTDQYKKAHKDGKLLTEFYTEDETNKCLIITNSGILLEVPTAKIIKDFLSSSWTPISIDKRWKPNVDNLMVFIAGGNVNPINEKIVDNTDILNKMKVVDSKLIPLDVIKYDKDTPFNTSYYIGDKPSDSKTDNETKTILTEIYNSVVKTQSDYGKVGLKIYNELVTYKLKQEIVFSGEPEDDKTIEEKLNGYIILNINTVKDIIEVIKSFKGKQINFKFNNYLNKENQFEISDTDSTNPLNWEGENIGENSKLGGHGKIGYVFTIDKISKLKLKNLNGNVSLSEFTEVLTRFTNENETKDSTEVVIKFLNAKDVDKKDETKKDETKKDVKLKVGRFVQRGSVTWQLGSIQQVQQKDGEKTKVVKKFVPMSNSDMVFGITYQHTPVYEILPEQTLSYLKKLENTNIDGRLYYINNYYYYGILPFVASNTKLMSIFQSRTPKALNFLNALRSYQKIEGGGTIKEDEGKNFIKLSTKVDGEVEIEFEKTLMYKYYEHIDKNFLDVITSLKTTDAELQSKNAIDKISTTATLQQNDKLNMLKTFIIESYKFFTDQKIENNKIDFDSIIDTKGKSLKYIQNTLKVLNDNDAKSYTKIAVESLREVIRFCKRQQSKKASEEDTTENQIVNKRNTETIKSLTNVIDKIRTLHMKGNEDLFNTQLKTYITFLEMIEFYISNYKDSSPFERNITSDHFYTYPIKTDGLLKILGDTLGDYSILFAKVTSTNRVIIFSNNKSKVESNVKRVYIDIQHMKGDLRLLTSLLNSLGGGFR